MHYQLKVKSKIADNQIFRTTLKKVARKMINIISMFSSVSCQIRVLLFFETVKSDRLDRFCYDLIKEHRPHSDYSTRSAAEGQKSY